VTEEKFEAKTIYLTPVAASLVVAFLCGFLIVYSETSLETITPLPDTEFGALINASLFVTLIALGATFIYLAMRRFGISFVNFLTGFAFTAAVFLMSAFYLDILFYILDFQYSSLEIAVLAALITFFADYAVFLRKKESSGLSLICVGGALGAFLGAVIPTVSAFLILAFLAVYDVFAVFRGPVGKIAKEGLTHIRGISLSFRELEIGLGDLTFYSLFATHVLYNFGPAPAAAVALGILAGCQLSLKMLEKKKLFPGLPFAITLGFLALALTFALSLLLP